MKIQIISDIHQEFGTDQLDFKNADVIVFAGDVNIGVNGISWILKEIPDKPVIYVLGNHEYYQGVYPSTLLDIKEISEGTNVHVLENESITIDCVTFHGATLWTGFSLFGNPKRNGMFCETMMNDYNMIKKN